MGKCNETSFGLLPNHYVSEQASRRGPKVDSIFRSTRAHYVLCMVRRKQRGDTAVMRICADRHLVGLMHSIQLMEALCTYIETAGPSFIEASS
jgi:hypothetical protein